MTPKFSRCNVALLSLLLCLPICSLFGQDQFQRMDAYMPSANAASLGTYGTFPVSHFTGVPEINIPLYELTSGALTVPVSLSYHAAGVKPDQYPGWTGLNWTLNAGGMISRTVRDLPDEYDAPNTIVKRDAFVYFGWEQPFNIKGGSAGYWFNHAINDDPNWNDPARIKTLANDVKDAKDTEPDEFSFSFLGHSGSFYLDEKRNWQVRSDEGIKVFFDETFMDLPDPLKTSITHLFEANCAKHSDNLKSFSGFTLVTTDGTQYKFGGNTEAIDYSIPFHQQLTEHWVANTWYLMNIKSTDGREINFTYEHDDFIANMYVSFLWHLVTPMLNNNTVLCAVYSDLHQGFGTQGDVFADWITPKFASYIGSLIRPTYLKSISNDTEEILFTRQDAIQLKYPDKVFTKNMDLSRRMFLGITQFTCGDPINTISFWPFLKLSVNSNDLTTLLGALKWKKLSQVTIRKKNDLSGKGLLYELDYNDNPNERLMLQRVWKESLDKTFIESPYKFEYYSDFSLPQYLSESIDHWGYNNANTDTCFTLIRTLGRVTDAADYITKSQYVRNPTTDPALARSGSLKKITFPTGGTSEFQYELNDYSTLVLDDRHSTNSLTNTIAGGIRIRKILSSPSVPVSPVVTHEYFYVSGYTPATDPGTLPSSGILGGLPKYYFNVTYTLTDDPLVHKINKVVISSQNIQPFSVNNAGAHIGYSEVTEKLADGGYTVYKYTNYNTSFIAPNETHYDDPALIGSYTDIAFSAPHTDKSFERGRLVAEEIYSVAGAPLQKRKLHYIAMTPPNTSNARALSLTGMDYCGSMGGFLAYSGYPYFNYTYQFKLDTDETQVFDQDSPSKFMSTKITYNIYNPLGQPKLITEEKGIVKFIRQFRYPADIGVFTPPVSGDAEGLYMLQQQNINPAIESFTTRILKPETDGVISGTFVTYQKNPNNAAQVVPKTSYGLKTTTALPFPFTYSQAGIVGNNIVPDARYQIEGTTEFNANGDLASVLSFNGIRTSYLWTSDRRFISAKVVNAIPSQIYHTSFEDINGIDDSNPRTGSRIRTSNFTISLPVTNGNYILSYWSRTSGTWALTTTPVTVSTSLYSTTITASASVPVDEIRFYPADAQMTTFTYESMNGMTSMTDVNNRTEFYEYDVMYRLKCVKDDKRNITRVIDYNKQSN